MIGEPGQKLADYLTAEETTELAKIQRDPLVVGYAVLTHQGEEIEAGGIWRNEISPIFANVFDIANKIGAELGEDAPIEILVMESGEYEVAGLSLLRARAVIVKQKGGAPASATGGLRSVS
jgi:hypothetical protein